jgi:hypothetical protein
VTKIQLLQVLESREQPVPFVMKALEVTKKFESRAVEDIEARMKGVKDSLAPNPIRVKEVISSSFLNFMGPYISS